MIRDFGGNVDVWEFRKRGRTEKIAVQARYVVTSSLAVRDALRGGFGVNLIPLPYVAKDLQDGRLQSALDDWTTPDTVLRRCFRRNSQQDLQDDESTDQKAQKGVNLMQKEIEPGRFEAGDMIRVRAPDPT